MKKKCNYEYIYKLNFSLLFLEEPPFSSEVFISLEQIMKYKNSNIAIKTVFCFFSKWGWLMNHLYYTINVLEKMNLYVSKLNYEAISEI